MKLKPNVMEIHLGNECNNNCLTCLQRQKKDLIIENKIPSFLNVEEIFFTGGESLLYFDDILACYLLIPKETKSITIFTNGRLIPQIINKLPNDRRIKFIISLYSMTPDIHDYITNVKNSYIETIEGINICKANNITYELSIPIFKFNVDGVKELLDEFPDIYKNITLGRNIDVNNQPNGVQIKEFLKILDNDEYSRTIRIKYFPLCMFPDNYRCFYVSLKENTHRKKISTYGNKIVEYKKMNYTYETNQCKCCSLRNICDNILNDYINNYSFLQEVNSI